MIYFPQRTVSDCLLACLECLLQKSREEMPQDLVEFVKFYSVEGRPQSFLRYISVMNLPMFFGRVPLMKHHKAHEEVNLGNDQMILGIQSGDEATIHAVFWDGEKIFEPWGEYFYSGHELKIIYSIYLNGGESNRDGFLAAPELYRWDRDLMNRAGTAIEASVDNSNKRYMRPVVISNRIE